MNLDKFREFMEKIPVSILTLAVVGYFGWDYYSFMNGTDSPLFMKNTELTSVQAENDKFRTKVLGLKKFVRELENKRGELRGLATKLDQMKASLSDTFDVPSFMQMTVTEAKKLGLTVVALHPEVSVNKEYYVEQPFEFQFKGVYVQLLVFLHRLSQLQTIVRVDDFNIHPAGARSSGYTMLEGSVQIKGYHYLRSKADEVTQSGEAKK